MKTPVDGIGLVNYLIQILKSENRYFNKRELRSKLQAIKGKQMSLSAVGVLVGRARQEGHNIHTIYKTGYKLIESGEQIDN